MRYLIVHNTLAGFGSDAIYEFERALLQRGGDECCLRTIDNREETFEWAVKDARDFDLVVVSGGDGTISRILYELRGSPVPICAFPSGTANLLNINLGNSLEPATLARACHARVTASCDLGELAWEDNGMPHSRGFDIIAGIGFDAQVMGTADSNKEAMGEAAYFAAALSNTNPPVLHFVVECDGTRREFDGIGCMVANNATIQGDIQIVPDCRMDDGYLDVIVIESPDAIQLVRPLIAGLFDRSGKQLGRPHITSMKARHAVITASEPSPLQIDGNLVCEQTLSYTADVIANANQIIVDRTSPYNPANVRR